MQEKKKKKTEIQDDLPPVPRLEDTVGTGE